MLNVRHFWDEMAIYSAWYAWGNVNYTPQCAFPITLNVHPCPCRYCVIVRHYSNRQIHLALLDNEGRKERLPLQLSRTVEHPHQRRNVIRLLGLNLFVPLTFFFYVAFRGQDSQESHRGPDCVFKHWPFAYWSFYKGRSDWSDIFSLCDLWFIITHLNEHWLQISHWKNVNSWMWCTS